MLVYPQLSTGCIAQFPIERRQSQRTFLNETADGRQIRVADPDAATVRWAMKYTGLTDVEKQSIEDLFVAAEGRLRTFAFLDPTANLLARTGDLTSPVWDRDPLFDAASGATDPFGGRAAWTMHNAGPVAAMIAQTITCPGDLQYCLSVYVRSMGAPADCTLRITTPAGHAASAARVSAEWTRMYCAARIPGSADAVTFAFAADAGSTVSIYGPQVDPQPFPSGYKTAIAGGVYLNTRFDQDVLQVRTEGANNHSLSVRLVSRGN